MKDPLLLTALSLRRMHLRLLDGDALPADAQVLLAPSMSKPSAEFSGDFEILRPANVLLDGDQIVDRENL